MVDVTTFPCRPVRSYFVVRDVVDLEPRLGSHFQKHGNDYGWRSRRSKDGSCALPVVYFKQPSINGQSVINKLQTAFHFRPFCGQDTPVAIVHPGPSSSNIRAQSSQIRQTKSCLSLGMRLRLRRDCSSWVHRMYAIFACWKDNDHSAHLNTVSVCPAFHIGGR